MNTKKIKDSSFLKRFSSVLIPVVAMASFHAQAEEAMPKLDLERTAVVITDPQNDFLSPEGATWGLVGKSVTENKTVEHIADLFKAAKANNIPVFVSPHYYYPTDKGWQFGGTIENVMHKINMFNRSGALSLEGFEGSGADWLEVYKPFINDGHTIVTNPHKVYGPESNDLALQMRKRKIDTVILAGMSANLCTEAHMRELLEQGFEVIVVKDATAAAQSPDLGDGYASALVNFGFMANEVVTTEEIVNRINRR
jgi:nicotinamidase-related amidase